MRYAVFFIFSVIILYRKVDNLFAKPFGVFQSDEGSSFFSLYITYKKISLLHHPPVAFCNCPLWMVFTNTFGYHNVIVIFPVIFHILFGIR